MERICFLNMIRFLLFHFLIIFLFMAAAAAANTIDRDALLSLKAHITHDPNNISANNWNTSSSVCNWMGITCDVHSHRVRILNLSSLGLTGTIPAQLGNLSSLQTLDLRNNHFSGTIPSSIFNISSLLVIDLKNNSFYDELRPNICDHIPKLEILYLSYNMLYGKIPSTLSNCRQLRNLTLSSNDFSGTIPKEICNLTKLQELYFYNNKLKGEILHDLGNLAELEMLSLGANNLTGTIPKEIFNLTKLKGLYLFDNKLRGTIPKEIGNLIKLKEISLSVNKLEGEIPHDLGNLTELESLVLGSNNLIGEIPHEIGNLHNLEFLELYENKLVGVVPIAIFNMSTLKSLALYNNSLSGSLGSSTNIGLPNLEAICMWGNNFTGTIPSFIFNASMLYKLGLQQNAFSGFMPDTFGNLRNLNYLSLYDNFWTSSTPELNFLSSLSNCKNLDTLSLSLNPLNGILPRAVGNLSHSLTEFYMYHCNISGGIPEEIGNLTSLTTINLGINKLNGSISNSLGRLGKLQALVLQDNKLEGLIPDDICHLTELYWLDLSGNRLSGSIPACLGNLTSLGKLYLSSNELTSTIPSTLWNVKFILYLHLSSNFLSGPLPLVIGNLKVLVELDLSRNNLSGVIPTTMGSLKDLQDFSLAFNRLEGPIPDSFGELTSLNYLNLSNNNLSGEIPASLRKLLGLKYLNLSFNKLEGEIPKGGPFANFSAASFLGNDLLCGSSDLQVPPCKTNTHRKSRKKALLLGIILPLSIAFIVVVNVLIFRSQKRRKSLPKDANVSPQKNWRRFSYLELLRATEEFSENNLLGKGNFGSVYKAILQDGMEIAVKVFHLQSERALKSFDVECEVMKSIRHRNLVKIISSCSNNDDFKALVLEYMPNGSLEKCLYSINCVLDIFQRLNIMIDVASGLEYLHFGYSAPIIHCDLKPSNVLLDGDMVAHLSDFGIAKLLIGEDQSMTQTQTLATIGYMAPEYGREGQVSTKGDVYSFGIMLMETFTAKKPTDEVFAGDRTLKCWVNDLLPISVMELVDANLLRLEDEHFVSKEQCVSSVLNLGLECVAELPEQRITAKEIARRLSKIRNTFLKDIGDRRRRR